MTRLLQWAALAAFLLPFSACDKLTETDDASDAAPSVSVVLSNATIHPSDSPVNTVATVIAKAPAQGMSLSAMILDATGNVATDKFTTDFARKPSSSDSTFSTSDWKITSKLSTPPGTYTLKVIVTDKKGRTANQTANFKVVADATSPTGELAIVDWTPWGTVSSNDFSSPSGKLQFSSSFVELSIRIRDLSNRDVTSDFYIEYPSEVTSSPFDLSHISVIARGADLGEYVMDLVATDAKGVEISKQASFQVVEDDGSDGFVMEGPVTLGAQSNSNPSFLQIQGGSLVAWTSSNSKPTAMIDLVVGVDAEGILSLMSPNQANGDGFTLTSWATLNTTEIVSLGTEMPGSRAMVLDVLNDGGYGGNSEKMDLMPDYYYGLRLVTGEVVVVHVDEITGSGRSAQAELTVLY